MVRRQRPHDPGGGYHRQPAPYGFAAPDGAGDRQCRLSQRGVGDLRAAAGAGRGRGRRRFEGAMARAHDRHLRTVEHERAVDGVLYDAVSDPEFGAAMLRAIEHHRRIRGASGELTASTTHHFHELLGPADTPIEARVLSAEQTNTSIAFGDRMILKLFRRLDPGLNPDLEMSRFLTERHHFPYTPRLAGSIEFRMARAESRDLGILQSFVPNQGDAWQFTMAEL